MQDHDLQKGRRVDVIVVRESGSVRDMQRLTGIVIRIDPDGVALVTYNAGQLKRKLSEADEQALTAAADHSETS